jgi:hypothetical protein
LSEKLTGVAPALATIRPALAVCAGRSWTRGERQLRCQDDPVPESVEISAENGRSTATSAFLVRASGARVRSAVIGPWLRTASNCVFLQHHDPKNRRNQMSRASNRSMLNYRLNKRG